MVNKSIDDLQRLNHRERQALRVEELSADDLTAITATEPPVEAAQYDWEID